MIPIIRRLAGMENAAGGEGTPGGERVPKGETTCPTINWDEVLGNASFCIEAIPTEKTSAENDAEKAKVLSELGSEQLLHVSVQLDLPGGVCGGSTEQQTQLVLVVDRSGSMSGNPWKQVQSSLKDLIGRSLNLSNLQTDLIVYNDKAELIKFQSDNYVKVIDGMRAGGTTSFKDAFTEVKKVVTNAGPSFTRAIIVFMTDGCDTVTREQKLPALIEDLSGTLTSVNKDTCVHAVGFTKEHNFNFLKKLAETGGTTPGMFRYCEPGEITASLQQKLDELFDFILDNTTQPATIHVSMNGEGNYFIGGTQKNNKAELEAMTEEDGEGKNTFTCETWIHVNSSQDLPDFEVFVDLKTKEKVISIPCICNKAEVRLIESAEEKATWQLRILTRNVEDLVTRTGSAIANKGDVGHFQEQVEKYQRIISRTVVFGSGITKERRETLLALMKETQSSLDKVQSMLAEYLRAGTDSISLLARAHDMRYQAVFSKNRRQRVMDKRVTQNMKHAQEAQDRLARLAADTQEVDSLSQEALQFFFCVLSQDSVRDVLLGDDKADVIGFGLAVKRSEVVLDEPTLTRLQDISGTRVSRNAWLDALEHKINVSSQLTAHGGFSFRDSPLGVTTVGMAREPINSWLPLYIIKSHWDRVKVILKPALGSFCTLDPLGYHYKQLDVMFVVLGSMIGQLSDKNVGEHQLRLLFAVQRTCAACLVDFDLHDNVKELVKNFLASPEGRTKDIIPNLFTLIGYIVAMPTATATEIFCKGGDTNKVSVFWLGFIAELLRRSAGSHYSSTNNPVLHGLLNVLLHGRNGQGDDGGTVPECEAFSQLVNLCRDPGLDDLDLQIPTFDPAAEVKVPTVTLKHDPDVDKAMEQWAQGKTGFIKNLSRNKGYKRSTGVVKKWLKDISVGLDKADGKAQEVECLEQGASKESKEIKDHDDGDVEVVAVEDADDDTPDDGREGAVVSGQDVESVQEEPERKKTESAETESQFECQHVTGYMLKVIVQLLNKMCSTSFPGIQSLPGCIAFVENWLSRQHDITDLDTNSGLPPQAWIEEVKEAVTSVYRELRESEAVNIGSSQEKDVLLTVVEADSAVTAEDGQQPALESGKGTSILDTNDDDDDDDDDDYDDEDGYDVDDYTDQSRRQAAKKKQQSKAGQVLLPTILQYLAKDQDTMILLRAILCQAIRFHSNSSARAAITSKTLLDLQESHEARVSTLYSFHSFLAEHMETVRKGLLEKVMWQQANHCMLHASTTWAFVGYLMNVHHSRLEGFSDLVDLLLTTVDDDSFTPPCLQEKVHILLTGKYQELPVLDNGNQWLPEKKMAAKFQTLLGPEIWQEFEMELRSCIQIHVYRESDIPNRHGHHNSHPYIPNVLRRKLGMELISDGEGSCAGRRGQKRK